MSEVKKLNDQIASAQHAAHAAQASAEQAQLDYDAAIEQGDVSRADTALQAKAAAQRQKKIHDDHIMPLYLKPDARMLNALTVHHTL